jgi:hypothetical protein
VYPFIHQCTLGGFPHLAIVNSVATDIYLQVVYGCFSILLGRYLGVKLLGQMVILCLTFFFFFFLGIQISVLGREKRMLKENPNSDGFIVHCGCGSDYTTTCISILIYAKRVNFFLM